MDTSELVVKFAAAVEEQRSALFLGAGISANPPSSLPTWMGLMAPEVASLGLQLLPTDNLPLMSQHIVTRAHGNRGPLVGAIRRQLGGTYPLNSYHRSIAATDIRTIWTTNFDTLLEKAFARENVIVRVDDSGLTTSAAGFDREIIKVHGCISQSKPDELVITQEDFEEFPARRSAMAQRLRADLLEKSFLFAGYQYGDPNISTVMVEARRLARGATQQHFLIMRTDPKWSAPERMRAELWTDDLRRFGIETAWVKEYSDIDEALKVVSVRSRGRSVFATGSHSTNSALAADLGTQLADIKPRIRLNDGQSEGIGRTVASHFGLACLAAKQDLIERIRQFPNPYAVHPSLANNPSLIDELQRLRWSLFRATRTVLVFDGGMGTDAEVEVARELDCQIIPVPETPGGSASKLLSDPSICASLDKLDPRYRPIATARTLTSSEVISIVEKSLS